MDPIPFFLGQLDRENTLTMKVLNEVPEGKNTWKPHERSMELGYLAALTAQMSAWIAMMIATDELDPSKGGYTSKFQREGSESREALLELAEQSYAAGKSALEGTTEDHLNGLWSFKLNGATIMSGTRINQIADTFGHLAHHRGQLTVYLRLLGEKVPATYGPSADEQIGSA